VQAALRSDIRTAESGARISRYRSDPIIVMALAIILARCG